jgi:hypothetical protein
VHRVLHVGAPNELAPPDHHSAALSAGRPRSTARGDARDWSTSMCCHTSCCCCSCGRDRWESIVDRRCSEFEARWIRVAASRPHVTHTRTAWSHGVPHPSDHVVWWCVVVVVDGLCDRSLGGPLAGRAREPSVARCETIDRASANPSDCPHRVASHPLSIRTPFRVIPHTPLHLLVSIGRSSLHRWRDE